MTEPRLAEPRAGTRRTADERRECIISAARALFARNGFGRTGMAQIAETSQVLVGQIYRDFADKEDLIAAIVKRDISELLDDPELSCAIEGGEEEHLGNWLRRFIGRSLDEDTRRVLAAILAEGTRNPRISAILTAAFACLRDRIAMAARVWAPSDAHEGERQAIADLILTAAGAIQHRQIFGVDAGADTVADLIAMIEREVQHIRRL